MAKKNEQEMPSAVLRQEHRVIERVLQVLDRLVTRAEREDGFEAATLQRCVEFFRPFADACHHAKEEDNILFNMGDRVMTRADQDSLCTRFCEVGCRAFDGKRREELEALADELERRWPET